MLPDDGRKTAWPPAEYAAGFELMETHGRLWRGDVDRLEGHTETSRHVPLPQDITEASSDMLFGDPPIARAPGSDLAGDTDTEQAASREAQQQLLDALFNTPQMQTTLLEAGEVASAYGGVYLRVGWDADIIDRPVVLVTDPVAAVPEFRLGRMQAVTFWTEYTHRRETWRLLEQHTRGRISYALYRNNGDMLGQRVPLAEIPQTEHLVDIVDADSGINTGSDRLTAVYVKNQAPNRMFRTGNLREYGRSDFAGAEHLFAQLDEAYGSWMRDIRLGRGRILADEGMLTPRGDGRGASFDSEREVFTTVDSVLPDQPMTVVQFSIRVQEHQQTITHIVGTILRRAGLSESTFGAAEGLETATGVKAKERMSVRTRAKKIVFWRDSLADLVEVLADVNAAVFDGQRLTARPDVRFPAQAQADLDVLAGTIAQLRAAQAMSIETAVRLQHPNWDSPTVNDEVARISTEHGLLPAGTPDLTDLGSIGSNDEAQAGTLPDAADMKAAFDALGVAIRAGVDPEDAARQLGISGIRFTGAVPTSLRMPENDATGLEER